MKGSLLMTPITETTLRFTGDWPLGPVVGVGITLALLMWLLYRRELRLRADRWAFVPPLCRALAVFLLVMALAGPVLRHETTLKKLGRVVLALDASSSMRLTDGESTETRWERLEKALLQGESPLLQKLAETSDVELVTMRARQVQRLWWWRQRGEDTSGEAPSTLQVPADGTLTDLDTALRQALGPSAAGSALVLFSDGQHNADGSPEELSQSLKSASVPVFTIGFGAEVSPPDLSIVDVVAPEAVFAEEVVRGRILLRDQMPAGLPGKVQVEGTGGAVLWQQAFNTDGKGDRSFDFAFPVSAIPELSGSADKALRLCSVMVGIAGEKAALEKTRANNTAEVALHVLEKKRRVLILDGRARWETRYVHNHFERDEHWQTDLAFDDYGGVDGALAKAFPKSKEDLLSYDLVIIGDLHAARLEPERMLWLREFVEQRGGGLVLIDGARGGLRSWQDSAAGALLPVQWMGEAKGISQTLTWRLANDAARYPALRLSESPSANEGVWPTLPEARWAALTEALPGAVSLAHLSSSAQSQLPGMVFRNAGAGAVLYLASDELWRWRYQVADLYHQRLWMQIASWIAAPPFQVDAGRIAIGTDRFRYRAGEQAELRVRLTDAAGHRIKDGQPRAFLLLDGKEMATLEMAADPTHIGVYRAITPPLKSGQWQVAVAEAPGAAKADGRLTLRVSDASSQELSALTMNRILLESMARNTGGRFLREEQMGELINLLQSVDQKQVSARETILWSSWWWLGAVIALLTVEWLMRRKLRLV
jgi:hypothetical protein